MGTKISNCTVANTIPSPTNVDELHNEYKQYKLLKKKDEMNSKNEAGTTAYIVALSWIQKYE